MAEGYRVRMSGRAAADVASVHAFIATDSPQNADRVALAIIKAIDSLALFPHRYPIYSGRRQPRSAVRRMPVAPVLVYYRIDEAEKVVQVISVRHGKRRPPRRLG